MNVTGFYDIYVPSLKQYKAFSEITTRQQKLLSKSIMADDGPYKTELLKCIIMILNENNVDNTDIDRLSIIDCFSVLLALKCYSIGPSLNLNVTCGNCKAKHKVSVPLIALYNSLTKLNLTPKILNINKQKILCSLPSIKKELAIMYQLKKLEANDENAKQTNLLNIIRFVSNPNGKIDKNLLENYDIKDLKKILNCITKFNKSLSTLFAYKIKCPAPSCQRTIARQLKLEFPMFYAFIKLIFNDDLRKLYKDVYFLNKIGLQANYIDSLTAVERIMFWSLYSEEQKNKKSKLKKPANAIAGI